MCGSILQGACSIVVSGKQEIVPGDSVASFHYDAELRRGGKALLTSKEKNLPIRVFRSSAMKGKMAAQPLRVGKSLIPGYRYDGLYAIVDSVEIGNGFIRFQLVPCNG